MGLEDSAHPTATANDRAGEAPERLNALDMVPAAAYNWVAEKRENYRE